MTPNNNLSILPFYDSIDKQNHRKDYAFTELKPLITRRKFILPFQIVRETRQSPVTEVLLLNLDGTTYADITDDLFNGGLQIKRFTDYDIIIFPSIAQLSLETEEGVFYVKLSDTEQTWYSDIFSISNGADSCLKIRYSNNDNLYYNGGHLDFSKAAHSETIGNDPDTPNQTTASSTICFVDNSAFANRGRVNSIRINMDAAGDFDLIQFRKTGTTWTEISRNSITAPSSGDNTIDLTSLGLSVDNLDTFGVRPDTAQFKYKTAQANKHFISSTESGGVYSFTSSVFPALPGTPNEVSLDFEVIIDASTYPFYFTCYISTQLGMPDYVFEEDVENRDGYPFVEKQISEKVFKFKYLAPEHLLDSMRIIRMCDFVEIVNKGDNYTADQFLITPKWEDGGYLASVEAEFQCDTVIKKIGSYTLGGDFNDDFNDDFKL